MESGHKNTGIIKSTTLRTSPLSAGTRIWPNALFADEPLDSIQFNIRFICDNMQDKPPADTAATGGYKKFKKYLHLCL